MSKSSENLDKTGSHFVDGIEDSTNLKNHNMRYSKSMPFERIRDGFDRNPNQKEQKTPYEIFLEDDGPYSRKLFAPVTRDASENRKYTENLRVNKIQEETKTKINKKGLLWHKGDKLFSR